MVQLDEVFNWVGPKSCVRKPVRKLSVGCQEAQRKPVRLVQCVICAAWTSASPTSLFVRRTAAHKRCFRYVCNPTTHKSLRYDMCENVFRATRICSSGWCFCGASAARSEHRVVFSATDRTAQISPRFLCAVTPRRNRGRGNCTAC